MTAPLIAIPIAPKPVAEELEAFVGFKGTRNVYVPLKSSISPGAIKFVEVSLTLTPFAVELLPGLLYLLIILYSLFGFVVILIFAG